MNNVIALPTSSLKCQCGKRMAPHPLASMRMGMPYFLHCSIRCECGSLVIEEGGDPAGGALCAKCNSATPDVKVEVSSRVWEDWCLDCLEAEDGRTARI